MQAELILIATRHPGQDLAADARFLAGELEALGIPLGVQTTVECTAHAIIDTLGAALRRSGLIILVGGLSPERGDTAREIVCRAASLPVEMDEPSLARLRVRLQQEGRILQKQDARQAIVPSRSTLFPNDFGGAPGCAVESGGQCIMMLPDGLRELAPMFITYIARYLPKFADCAVASKTMRVVGLRYDEVCERVGDMRESDNPTVTLYPEPDEVLVRVVARAERYDDALEDAEPFIRILRARLGSFVYGEDVDSIEQVVVGSLLRRRLHVSVMDSCTGGLVAQRMGDMKGSGQVLSYAVSAPGTPAKLQSLGIAEKLIRRHSPVSAEVAVAMARAVFAENNGELGLAITGNLSRDGATDRNPVGLCYLAMCDRNSCWVKKLELDAARGRDALRATVSTHALDMLRRYLDAYPQKLPGEVILNRRGEIVSTGPERDSSGRTVADPEPQAKRPWYRRLGRFLFPLRGDRPLLVLRKLLVLLLLLAFFASCGYLGWYFFQSYQNSRTLALLRSLYTREAASDTALPENYPDGYLASFAALWQRNPDIAGYLKIDGTDIDFPVVQSETTDYTETDFLGQPSRYGSPYLSDAVEPSGEEGTAVYAKNMSDGQMFADLAGYQEVGYYRTHPVIQFDSVYALGSYKVIGAYLSDADTPTLTAEMAEDPAAFNDYLGNVQARSFFSTGVETQFGDELLTLTTGSDAFEGATLTVVARRVREGESTEVDTDLARTNPAPLMPDAYYEAVADHTADPAIVSTLALREPEPLATGEGAGIPDEMIAEEMLSLSTASSTVSISSEAEADAADTDEEAARDEEDPEDTASEESEKPPADAAESSSDTPSSEPPSSSTPEPPAESTEASEGNPPSSSTAGVDEDLWAVPPSSSTPTPSWPSSEGSTSLWRPSDTEEYLSSSSDPGGTPVTPSPGYAGTLRIGGVEYDAHEAVCRMVTAEMGESFHIEALKAQAVAAYTYVRFYNDRGQSASIGMASSYKQGGKVDQAVSAVLGQMVTYGGAPINATFFATAAFGTNNASDVWGTNYSYLVSVPSDYDRNVSGWQQEKTLDASYIISRVRSVYGIDLSYMDPSMWFTNIQKNAGGYVTSVTIGGMKTVTGRQLRENLLEYNIRSAAFDVTPTGSGIRFTTYGYGHGVGMSQNGAQQYATRGWSYVDILTHYYQGTTVS